MPEYAWFNVNPGGKTHPVGRLKPNGWSLCDVHGNVWEWCADYWEIDYYAQSPPDDPSGPSTGSRRVIRGGGWLNHAGRCRSARRYCNPPDRRRSHLGFRPVIPTDLANPEPPPETPSGQ